MREGTYRRKRVQHLLETVALSHAAKKQLKTFSGGMKRRIGVMTFFRAIFPAKASPGQKQIESFPLRFPLSGTDSPPVP